MAISIPREALVDFVRDIFAAKGLGREDASVTADVLVAADARGVPSHGTGRLWRYLAGIDKGVMKKRDASRTAKETETSLVIDAAGSMGPPVSFRTMERVIGKASETGFAFASVGDSNHFGIAGYYAMMALEKDMIGIAMTNTAALGVPTFGRRVMFGTNPLAVAVPAGEETPFVLDMATTVIPRGKIEVYEREGKDLPAGWAVNEKGLTASDPGDLLKKMLVREGGGILPLGGDSERFGGHKGFGLAVMVDIFCALLAGSDFGEAVADSEATSARVSHFFGAMDVSRFREVAAFKADMDAMLSDLADTPPAEGRERVWYAGLKEAENERRCASDGVPLSDKVWESIAGFGKDLGVALPA